jgi:hypothetical protein
MGFPFIHHLHQVLLETHPNGPSRPEEQPAAADLFGATQSLDGPAGGPAFVLIHEALMFFTIYFDTRILLYGIK